MKVKIVYLVIALFSLLVLLSLLGQLSNHHPADPANHQLSIRMTSLVAINCALTATVWWLCHPGKSPSGPVSALRLLLVLILLAATSAITAWIFTLFIPMKFSACDNPPHVAAAGMVVAAKSG